MRDQLRGESCARLGCLSSESHFLFDMSYIGKSSAFQVDIWSSAPLIRMQILIKTTTVEFEDKFPIPPDTQAWFSARTRIHTNPQRATLGTTSALLYH